ncbi:hypothetical protein R8Z50_00745 [Longispora sp. K20-0274]|uniref:LppU/SCO3897 family protein n=1 Tax=Longispora sp. K20-0274 TaxID=3088255 RepID=UPI00399A63E0
MSNYGPPPGDPGQQQPYGPPPPPNDPYAAPPTSPYGPGAPQQPPAYGPGAPGGYGPPPPSDPYGQPQQPSDPYGQPPQHDPYGQPQQPPPNYGQPQQPSYGQPYGQPQYEPTQPYAGQPMSGPPMSGPPMSGPPMSGPPMQQPGWSDPQPWTQAAPPKKSKTGLIVGIIVVVFVLLLGCGVGGYFLMNKTDKKNDPVTPTPTPVATSASPTPSPTPSASKSPDKTTALRAITPGKCIKNAGTDDSPDISIVPCGAGTYEVLKNIPGKADAKACDGVAGYTTSYTSKNTVYESLSFTLCLKSRTS